MKPLMIDASHSRDRDDAIHVQSRPDGGWTCTVFIADVPAGLPLGSDIDTQARSRRSTRYGYGVAPTRPMLPPEMEQRLTLVAEDPRPAVIVRLEVSASGEVEQVDVWRGLLAGAVALDHATVPAALADERHPLHQDLECAEQLALTLLAHRRTAGALAFYDLVRGWATDEDGQLIRLSDPERNAGYIIVQECMIAANAALASWAIKYDVPIMFRNHLTAQAAPSTRELAQEVEVAVADGSRGALELASTRLLMVMRPAKYEAIARGHFALTLPAYTHATSPLRRYADVVTLRQVVAHLEGEPLPYRIEALEELANEINKGEAERRQRQSAALKERRHRDIRAAVVQGAAEDTPARELSAMIKRAAKEGLYGPNTAAEVLRRAEAGRLALADLAMLLTVAQHEGWQPIQRTIVGMLAERPHDVVSILSIHTQLTGGRPLEYEDRQEAGFLARARLDGLTGEWRAAPTKKAARQQAALSVLAALVKTEDPSIDTAPAEPEPIPERPVPQYVEGAHPVSVLNEWVQTGVLGSPEWSVRKIGPDHAPKFIAYITARNGGGEVRGTGEAGSKTGARERAAAHLIDQIKSRSAS